MKKINMFLGALVALSLCGNVYLYGQQQEQAGQLVAENDRLSQLQTQAAEQQAGLEQLTAQMDEAQAALQVAQEEASAAQKELQAAEKTVQLAAIESPVTFPTTSPAYSKPYGGSSSANDLLNEALGGGSSKPSGGGIGGSSSGGGWYLGGESPGESALNNALDGAKW